MNTVQELGSDKIDFAPDNPNAMEPEKYALLVQAIQHVGFLQPILVRPKGDRFEVVDGEHRLRAARDVGMQTIPCVVATGKNVQDDYARALRVSLNNLRGDLNLASVGNDLTFLLEAGWGVMELGMTGFNPNEIRELVDAVSADTEDIMAGAANVAAAGAGTKADGPFILEVEFSNKEDMQRAKRAIKKAGAGGGFAAGLLALIDQDTEESS